MTEYVVLEGHNGEYRPIGSVKAASARAAISTMLSKQDQGVDAGEFVAVPARSWKVEKVQTATALKFT